MTLRSKLIRLAHAQPELRPHLLPLLKEAAVNMKRQPLEIPLQTGGSETVDAIVAGPWAVHKNIGASGYAVTFIPSGRLIYNRSKTLMDAKGFLEAMLEAAPDLLRANDVNDVMRHRDVIMALIKNPPALSGTAKKPPVERVFEKREKLIEELKNRGLKSYGERSGKAGQFFAKWMSGRMGDSPTRALSVGNRDLLRNEFQMRDERWVLVDSKPISTISPEILDDWVKWTIAGPSRGELRYPGRY